MFSKLSLISLVFVAAVSVNGMSFDDYLMEREFSSDMLDVREPFSYLDARDSFYADLDAREPFYDDLEARALAEIREAVESLDMEAREPEPVPVPAPAPVPHHNKNHKERPKKHAHNKHTKVIVEKVVVEKHNKHKHKKGSKLVVVEKPAVTKTITANGSKQTIVEHAGGPTITLAPQGTVTVYQGVTYTIAKPKATSVNRLTLVKGKLAGKKNDAQSVSAASSMKLYALLGALTAVGALFA